jgi:hypothetical protein
MINLRLKCGTMICAVMGATPAFADYNDGYIYWPGHLRGGYEVRLPNPSRSDRMVDPVAIASVMVQLASIPKADRPRDAISRDPSGSRSATKICTAAAEDRFDGSVRVSSIGPITQSGDRFTVRGTMMGDQSFYRFSCDTQFGTVERVDFGPPRSEASEYGPP